MELYQSIEGLDMSFGEFRKLPTGKRKHLAEYDQHREALDAVKCSREEWLELFDDPVWCKAKLDQAYKTLRMQNGDDDGAE